MNFQERLREYVVIGHKNMEDLLDNFGKDKSLFYGSHAVWMAGGTTRIEYIDDCHNVHELFIRTNAYIAWADDIKKKSSEIDLTEHQIEIPAGILADPEGRN